PVVAERRVDICNIVRGLKAPATFNCRSATLGPPKGGTPNLGLPFNFIPRAHSLKTPDTDVKRVTGPSSPASTSGSPALKNFQVANVVRPPVGFGFPSLNQSGNRSIARVRESYSFSAGRFSSPINRFTSSVVTRTSR